MLLTVPSIVSPPAPLLLIVKEVPSDVTLPVEVICKAPFLLRIFAMPVLLLTFPATVKPLAPVFSILRLVPFEVTEPPLTIFKPP